MININKIENRTIVYLVLIYIILRLLFYFYFGIKADPNVIKPGWHVLDLNFLNHDLFNSIIHLHSQPPLWNTIIGIFTKFVDGNRVDTSILLNIFNYFLSIGIIVYSFKVLSLLNFSNKFIFFILIFFIVLNPNIIFFENITLYNHVLCFLFTHLFWLIFIYFKTKRIKYELSIYLNILIQSLIWAGIHPILLMIVFLFISFKKKKFIDKGFYFFILIFFLSISPLIKNKIVFNKFTTSTWMGVNLASTLNNLEQTQCLYQIIYPRVFYDTYKKKYKRDITHPVARYPHGFRNSVTQIILNDICLELSIQNIKNNPLYYLKGRIIAGFVSHSKLGFEYIYLSPHNFQTIKLKNFLDRNYFVKKIKQLVILLYMFIFYFFYIKKITKKNELQDPTILIGCIYIFCNLVSHMLNGYEHERFMYQFHILHVLFFSHLISKFYEKKEK